MRSRSDPKRTATVPHPVRHLYKRFLRVLRLIRKWERRKQIECLSLFLFLLVLFARFAFAPTIIPPVHDQLQDIEDHPLIPENHIQLPNHQHILEREAHLLHTAVCGRKKVREDVDHLRLCGNFPPPTAGKKIVALVEVRNAQLPLHSFLAALSRTVDSIVIIDDHSTDATRNVLLEFNAAITRNKTSASPHRGLVEIFIKKSGEWVREELLDRQLLLEAAREVGGTHFVLLDYDEYLSANCVNNGLLRRKILSLNPGESLYLPWVELWKSPALHRVLPQSGSMNFLKRRQIVIFADDTTFEYTPESSIARRLAPSTPTNRESTIHVLRCPRSICPQPARDTPSSSTPRYPPKVKHAPSCVIVEARFLNLNNVLLKSAWYEALGRVMGADDNVTRGKMIDAIFPKRSQSNTMLPERQAGNEVAVARTDREWLNYPEFEAHSYAAVETWRGEELLTWIRKRGPQFFDGLNALRLVDFGGLQTAMGTTKKSEKQLRHVPRQKTHAFAMIFEAPSRIDLTKVFRLIGYQAVCLDGLRRDFPNGVKLSEAGDEYSEEYEVFKDKFDALVNEALSKSNSSAAFATCAQCGLSLKLSIMELLRNELSDVHVMALFASKSAWGITSRSSILRNALECASDAGSHVRVLSFHEHNMGSFMFLHWLRDRLTMGLKARSFYFSAEDNLGLLHLAESYHREASSSLLPVAKLVFSLNAGRSGSKYFAEILQSVRGPISANHEPRCAAGLCSGGGAMRMQNRPLDSSYAERREIKLPMIREAIAGIAESSANDMAPSKTISCAKLDSLMLTSCYSTPRTEYSLPIIEASSGTGCIVSVVRGAVYAETNPNFKSWFYDIVLDEMPKAGYGVSVVVIRKYMAALMKSLYETGFFTNRDGYNWMETVASTNSRLKIRELQDDNNLDVYEKICSYLINTEATIRFVMDKYGKQEDGNGDKVEFIETRSERLYSTSGTLDLLRQLRLQPSSRTLELLGVMSDKYGPQAHRRRARRTSLWVCERKMNAFLNKVKVSLGHAADSWDITRRVQGFDYPQ